MRFDYTESLNTPANGAFDVVPDDVNPINDDHNAKLRGFYIGGAGDVVLRPADNAADVTFKNVPAGTFLKVRATHIRATGTTATFILALY